ncbi:MAG TPA: 16S rRNA (uracil(1498)-N(3))-methyltransferase [Castellaniella sp.]|uniref:16S rRNA (uracil(1498)-N(3))-methyltransferase n=1 Tax=Castellaniella sp. TaxID=1955812 RepID=UPI002EF661E8
MPAPRFFCPTPLQARQQIALPATTAHHALRALRLVDGDVVTLFNGEGGEYPATLKISGREVLATLGDFENIDSELKGKIRLVQGIASGDKMDWVVEKAVELGVSDLYPIAAERSVLKLIGTRLEKRLQHWRAIVTAASEQSGRNRLLQVHEPASLSRCLGTLTGLTLVCHPEGKQTFATALARADRELNLVVGPEGGWSPGELDHARGHGLEGIQFGPRILRTETAGIALVAAATAVLGW